MRARKKKNSGAYYGICRLGDILSNFKLTYLFEAN